MTGTIETTNNNILVKIECLNNIINILKKSIIYVKPEYILELTTITEEYEMGSIKILADYFLLSSTYKNDLLKFNNTANTSKEEINHKKTAYNIQKDKYFKNYQSFIKKENFVGKIDRLYNIFKNTTFQLINKNAEINKHINEIKKMFSKYENSTISYEIGVINYNKCPECKKDMKIILSNSELTCLDCGLTQSLIGVVFEDEQFYYQEGQRTKHGSYDPSKHCKFWIDRIQAKGDKEIPDKVINDIKLCIKRNKIKNIDEITCKEIRKYLRQTKNTIYNEHIPLIRKIITGITPPQLTDRETQLIIIYFGKAIKIYEEIKPADKMNVPYHPYLIYKIIEHILKDSKNKQRMKNILCCIHLQSRETLIENDKTWKQICERLDDVTYKPTDRSDLD